MFVRNWVFTGDGVAVFSGGGGGDLFKKNKIDTDMIQFDRIIAI